MFTWSSGIVTVNGEAFHYLRSSLPEGGLSARPRRPLVLCHGHLDNGGCMTPVAKVWAEDYDVILPDNRGHGRSPRVTAETQLDNVADHAGLLKGLGLKGVCLGGHSMGAATAAGVAAAYPELVSAVIVEDPPWWPPTPEPAGPPNEAWMQRTLRLQDMSRERRIEVEHADHPTWSQEELEAWADSKAEYDYTFIRIIGSWDGWMETVKKLRRPGLLLTGDNALGSIVAPAEAELVSQLWPQGRVVHVPGAGHNIRRDQPAAYLAAVSAFLKEHYPAR